MRIKKVSLENVKSYNSLTELPLGAGVSVMLGENGAGKSTVAEAVGYALFDYLNPYSQGDFVRDGAEHGRVKVEVSVDGEEFTVERHVGKSTYRVLKDGEEIETQKQNVIPWIHDKLGIPSSLDLGTLWNTSIGVPQGQLTSDFVQPPRKRRQSFDPVLQTAAYTDAWKDMREVENIIGDEVTEVEKDIRELEAEASGIEGIVEEREGAKGELQNLKSSMDESENKLEGLQKEKSNLENAKSKINDLRSKLDSKKTKIGALKNSIESAKELVAEAEEAKDALDKSEGAYDEYENKTERKRELEKKLSGKEDLEESRSSIKEKLTGLREKRKNLKEAIDVARSAKEKIESLEDAASKQTELEQKISKVKAKVERLKESISLLREVKDAECPTCRQILPDDQRKNILKCHEEEKSELERKASGLEEELSELGLPKKEVEKARTRYQDNKHAEGQLHDVENQIDGLRERKEKINSRLEEYKEVEGSIEKIENRLEELENAYKKHVRSEELASKLEGRKSKLEKHREDLSNLEGEKKKIEARLSEEEEKFDGERFEEVLSKIEDLSSNLSRLEARIESQKEKLEELDGKIEEKREAEERLKQRRLDKKRLEEDLEFTSFVRETIHNAQPLVTEVFVRKVSEEAGRIFSELRGENHSLRWTKDYQVIVQKGEGEKAFHKLSGGEQVCAALAVRLAILRRLAPISFAFLDEPTESLDDARKQHLASHLRKFEALDQLCVISHDRVFEAVTDQVVSLEKRDGETEVL